jgi:hypothetical protein
MDHLNAQVQVRWLFDRSQSGGVTIPVIRDSVLDRPLGLPCDGYVAHDWMMATDTEGDTDWADIATRLAPARNYWLGSTTAGGAPHVAPVWGAVVDDQLFVYTDRGTAKAWNIVHDPRVVIHLESAEDVVIVHGRMIDAGRPRDVSAVVDALSVKYDAPGDDQYLPRADEAFDVLYLLRPERAMLWELSDFDGSQRRWSSLR